MLCHVVFDNSTRKGVTIQHSIQKDLKRRQGTYTVTVLFFSWGDGDRSQTQREGMGLPEYQVMPSLRDVAHDGVLCTFDMGRLASHSGPKLGKVTSFVNV